MAFHSFVDKTGKRLRGMLGIEIPLLLITLSWVAEEQTTIY
jgi:hypothetical protein